MNHDNLINEYFDGNLDSTNQELLFSELSNNEELRYDFNQLFAMKLAIGKDTAAFVPAVSTSETLFANLGIAGASSTSSIAGFWSLYKTPILTALLASIATALVMIWLFPIGDGYNSYYKQEIPIVKAQDISAPNLTIVLPEETSREEQIIYKDPSTEEMMDSYLFIENRNLQRRLAETNSDLIAANNKLIQLENKYNSQNNPTQVPSKNIIFEEEVENNSNENYKTVFQSNFVNQPNSFSSNNTNFIINNFNTHNPETSIKLEAALGRYFQDIGADFVERNNTFTDNLRISGLYNLSREYSIGLDLRQENFYQEFTDVNLEGNEVLYQQQPTVYSASMIFRYSPEYLEFLQVRSNVDLSVGATNIGELARVGIGLDYYLFGNTYFYFKSDYTFLSYFHKNINFSSNKFGSHLGIGVEF